MTRRSRNRSIMLVISIALFITTVSLLYHFVHYRPDYPVREFADGWEISYGTTTLSQVSTEALLSIPKEEYENGLAVSLTRILPEEDEEIPSPTLLLDSYYLALRILVDGEEVTSFETEELAEGRFLNAQYFFASLPEDCAGKKLTIEALIDDSGADFYLRPPTFGAHRDLYKMHLARNSYPLAAGLFLTVFGFYFLIVSLFFSVLIPEIRGQVISAILSLTAGVWTLTQFRLTALFMQSAHTTTIEYITYFSFVPIYYVMLFRVHRIRYHAALRNLTIINTVALAIPIILHLTGTVHITRLRIVFYVCCFIMTLIWFYEDIYDLRSGHTDLLNTLQMAGPTLFAIFAWAGATLYLLTDYRRDIPPSFTSRVIFSTGALVFVVTRYMIYLFLLMESRGRRLEFESLTRIANADPLTGLYNRHYLTDRYAYLNESRRDYCLISLDLNHLKYVNDTFGHGKGDALLIGFADILKKSCPEHASCCRMGGDEFCVIMESAGEEQVKTLVARIEAEFSMLDKTEPMIPHSVAAGYAFKHELEEGDAHAVFLLADQRMYTRKQAQKEKEGLTYTDEGQDLLPLTSPHMDEKVSVGKITQEDAPQMDEVRRRRLDALFTAIATASEDVSAFLCDMKFDYSRWGKSVVDFFDLPGEYMFRAEELWEEHIHPEDRVAYHQSIEAIFGGGREGHDMQYRALSKDGKYVAVTSRGVVIKDADGRPEYFAGSIKNHGLQSHIDPVTGLRNQFGFTEDVGELIKSRRELKVLLVGVAQFAQINDVYGYNYGSRVLSKVGRVVLESAGASAEVYRMDGARFAVVSRDYTEEEMAKSYRLMQTRVKGDFTVDGKRQNLVLNGGLLTIDNFRTNTTTVMSCLNFAINESANKKNGDLVIFKNEMTDETRQTLEMLNVIRGCIIDHFRGFYLCYQYLVDAKTEAVTGAEALLRWQDDFYGNVPPGRYVPVLEQDPLFPELGTWILRQAMNDGNRFMKVYPDFVMNVNLSYSQLEKFDFVSMVSDIIEETGFPADHLCLEVTESCRVLDTEMLIGIIQSLKAIGVRFALDDFGTGFSSLSVLRQIRFDIVKIDRQFITDIERSEQPENTIRAIALLAQNYGAAVCVEGVETIEARDRLRAHPIKTFQGYLFAKPERIEVLLEDEAIDNGFEI
ncbi:MAG: EAL domain-containing protein [Lachnospiraceae bacterium]|nr:EAL domain-containing protein [Lachnospiraceae bacterium]